jgi:16S rRNA (cytosine1402-N4)-methyltransferase
MMMNYKKFSLLKAIVIHLWLRASSSFPLVHKRIRRATGGTTRCTTTTSTQSFAATVNADSTTSPDKPEQSPESRSLVRPRRRRPRYAGQYPRHFSEKYKEHDGDAATIVKVLHKGMTPAGTHVPIMLDECLEHLGLANSVDEAAAAVAVAVSTPPPPPPTPSQQEPQLLPPQQQPHHHQQQHPIVVVDCTLGYGGHAERILQQLEKIILTTGGGTGKLFGFDQDSIEIVKTTERLLLLREFRQEQGGGDDDDATTATANGKKKNVVEFVAVNQNFATVKSYLQQQQPLPSLLGQVTCLLADLGCSSMQMDDNQRGFTYKRNGGPLDMRMNPNDSSRETAYQLLQRLKPRELQRILEENSDEVHAKEIAMGLLGDGGGGGGGGNGKKKNAAVVVIPETTLELANRVRDIVQPLLLLEHQKVKNSSKNSSSKTAWLKQALDSTVARTMQAIRIEVNGEFQALEQLLDDLPDILAPGGRAVFLTFHSGEDRRVKKAMKLGFKSGVYSSWSGRDVIRPSSLERRNNPRSSSCKLRWVVKEQAQQG